MADCYIWSGATGTGTGASWANAYTTALGAFVGFVGTNDQNFFIASDHIENLPSGYNQFTSDGTYGSPNTINRLISVNRAGSVPPVSADVVRGAIIRKSDAAEVYVGNWAYYEGINWQLGYGLAAGTTQLTFAGFGRHIIMRNCLFDASTNTGTVKLYFGSNTCSAVFKSCQLKWGHATQHVLSPASGAVVLWDGEGTSLFAAGSVIPTVRIFEQNSDVGSWEFRNADLSALAAGVYIFSTGGSRNIIRNCKLTTGFLLGTSNQNPPADSEGTSPGRTEDVIDCTITDGSIVNRRNTNRGAIYIEPLVYRTTTPVLLNGVAYSWKIYPNYYASMNDFAETWEGIEVISVGDIGVSKTLTVEVLGMNATLTNKQCWIEVEYQGSSSHTMCQTASSHIIPGGLLQTAAQLTNSSASWTKPGSGYPNSQGQKLSATFTPQRAGIVRWKVIGGLPYSWYPPNYSIFVDPVAVLT